MAFGRETTFRARACVASALALCLAGCTALPSQGPNTVDVVAESNYEAGNFAPRYLVTNLDPRVVDVLRRAVAPTLYGRFGDGRGAPAQVIGIGDAVSVTVWEAASGGLFSSTAVSGVTAGSHSAVIPEQAVGRDGAITVPYAGRIQVAGLTPQQVEQAVVGRLQGKAIEPQALVTVPRNVSNTVTVTGEVVNGARVPLTTRGDRILDVVASAGGQRAPVHETFIVLSRGNSTVSVPMQALLANPRENIYVRPTDVLTVVREPQTFSVFGAIGKNALVPFDAIGITLEEALAKAGGLSDFQADPQGVFLLRAEPAAVAREIDPNYPAPPGPTVNVVYKINLKDAATYFLARKFAIRNKDVIYVASAPSTELTKALSVFGAIAQPALIGSAVIR